MTNPFGVPVENEGTSPFGVPVENEGTSPFATEDDLFEADITDVGNRIPAGDYPMVLVDITKEIANSGNPMFVWYLTVTEGDYAGRDFRLYTSLAPNALWKLAETAEAFGIGKAGEKLRFRKGAVKRCLVMGEVADSEYQGRETSAVNKLKAWPGGVGKKLPDAGSPFAMANTNGTSDPDSLPF